MNNLENKYGKYAVSGLSLKLVVLYVIGYVLYYTMPGIFALLTLDVTALLNTLNANEKSGSWRVRAVPTGNGAYTLTIVYAKSGFMIIFK